MWVARGLSDEMTLRGLYVPDDIPNVIRERQSGIADRLLCAFDDVDGPAGALPRGQHAGTVRVR
jgi:hypothetical protein